MMNFTNLKGDVDDGRSGKNRGIPMGFDRLNHYIGLRKKMYFLIGGLTGCLSGDTIINIRRRKTQKSSRNYTLKELYYKFNGLDKPRNIGDKINGHKWDQSIPTKCISYKPDLKIIGYNDIVNVFESGIKEVFLLQTKSGKSIKATKDHRFLIDNNIYKHLSELKKGNNIYIRSNKIPKGKKLGVYREVVSDRIISINSVGKEMTYDIEMTAPYHNYLANSIVSHNSGKTSLLDDAFVLNPVEWVQSKFNKKGQKLHIIYRSMERSRNYKLGKWVVRKIFLDTGRIISLGKLLGWTGRLSDDDYKLFLSYKDYIDDLSKIVHIIDGTDNPIGIATQLREHALENGIIEKVDKYHKRYVPNDPSVVTIVIIDHIGLLKPTKEYPSKKARIDKMSDELRYVRDFYGYTPVVVSQFNREIANINRIRSGDVEPQLEDFKDSSNTQDDADVVVALFDPMRYKVEDPSGYDLSKLRDQWGAKYFRSLRLIKNSYGEDDVRVGLGFLGQIGLFKELPKRRDMTENDYNDVVDKSFFIKEDDYGSNY